MLYWLCSVEFQSSQWIHDDCVGFWTATCLCWFGVMVENICFCFCFIFFLLELFMYCRYWSSQKGCHGSLSPLWSFDFSPALWTRGQGQLLLGLVQCACVDQCCLCEVTDGQCNFFFYFFIQCTELKELLCNKVWKSDFCQQSTLHGVRFFFLNQKHSLKSRVTLVCMTAY